MEKNILLESTTWTILNPTYTSTISQLTITIEEIVEEKVKNMYVFVLLLLFLLLI